MDTSKQAGRLNQAEPRRGSGLNGSSGLWLRIRLADYAKDKQSIEQEESTHDCHEIAGAAAFQQAVAEEQRADNYEKERREILVGAIDGLKLSSLCGHRIQGSNLVFVHAAAGQAEAKIRGAFGAQAFATMLAHAQRRALMMVEALHGFPPEAGA
jgi:hypothetical protein